MPNELSDITTFRQNVDLLLLSFLREKGRVYGVTLNGQRFVLVLSSVLWYAVRLIMEDSRGKVVAVERKEFYTFEEANKYVNAKKQELEQTDGNVKNFLNQLSSPYGPLFS